MQHGPHDPVLDHVDVLIVGAGLSGIGAACHLQDGVPGQDVRDPRGPRRHRRHLGPVPLPGHPLGLRHVHPRLRRSGRGRTPKAIADGASIRALRPGHRRASTASSGTIRFHHRVLARRLVDAPTPAGRSPPGAPTPARPCALTCSWLSVCSGYYRYDEGYRPAFAGEERVRRAGRAPAALARGPRLHRQAGRRHRQRRHRRHPGARAWPSEAAHVTMLQRSPELRPVAARPATRWPSALRRRLPGDGRLSDRAVEERAAVHRRLPVQPAPPGRPRGG